MPSAVAMPGGPVAGGRVEDLALLLEIVEGAQSLLDRRAHVEGMDEVEVKPVGAEPLQAGLDPADDVSAREASCIDVGPGRVEDLRAEDDFVTAVGDERSEDFLRRAVTVGVCGIEEVDPGFADPMEHFRRRLLVRLGAEGHRPEAERRHLYAS